MTERRPSAEDLDLAHKVTEWLASLGETEQVNDYLSNLSVYGRCGVVNMKGIGIVASAIQAFNRDLAAKVERRDDANSQFVGEVAKRLTLKLTLTRQSSIESHYGPCYLNKFVDESGNVFTWFGSNVLYTADDQRVEVGDTFWCKGTVKKHEDYKGVKQTLLSRVTWVPEPKAKKPRAKKTKALTQTPPLAMVDA